MIFKGRISFDKKNLPAYVFRFNVALICFFAVWFTVYVPSLITVACLFGDSPHFYVFLICTFTLFLDVLLIYCIVASILRNRFINECAAQLEEKFADMPLEEAQRILKQKGIINDNGFIFKEEDVFGDVTVAFESAEFSSWTQGYNAEHRGRAIRFKVKELKIFVRVYCSENAITEHEKTYELDGALFNFLDKYGFNLDLENNRPFVYLKYDKRDLCRYAYGFKLK